MSSSSGGNIAYQAALCAVAATNLAPLGLAGLVLHQPFIGRVKRTPLEVASEDAILPLRANDMLWQLALPEGADRDHKFCNPVVPALPLRLPRCLVSCCDGDPLVDRQRAFARMLEGEGTRVSVLDRLVDKGYHAIELFDPAMVQALFADVRDFVYGASVDGTAA